MAKKVLIPTGMDQLTEHYLSQKGYELVSYDVEGTDDFFEQAKTADGIVSMTYPYNSTTLDRVPNVKIIARLGVGYDSVDTKAAGQRGIWVTNTPGSNAVTVAESTIVDILLLSKNVIQESQTLRDGNWHAGRHLAGHDLSGKTVGIVGFGHIGQEVAKRLQAFGMTILYYNRSQKPSEYGQQVTLDELLRKSDFVSLHVPATPETHHLIGAAQLKMMKPTASLVNFARGAVVDELALIEALQNHTIRSAALDVFETEPLPSDSPLLKLDNVFLTPHTGSNTVEASARMALGAVTMVDQVLSGQKPDFAVNTLD